MKTLLFNFFISTAVSLELKALCVFSIKKRMEKQLYVAITYIKLKKFHLPGMKD